MRNMTRGLCAMHLAWALALAAGGCGKAEAGGEGSETHWLLTCDTDEDCAVGQCLCGVCTLPCTSLRDCPAPLDQCVPLSPSGASCESSVCGSTSADGSVQAPSVAEPYQTNRYPTCDDGREVVLTNIDVRGGPMELYPATAVVADYPSGFLLFGGERRRFYRVDSNGDLVRELPPPRTASDGVQFESAAPLEDGSLWLGGTSGERAWVGKVDEAWNVTEELDLEAGTDAALGTTVRPLPDGGAVVVVLSGSKLEITADYTESTIRSLYWARLSRNGQELWRKELDIEDRPLDAFTAPKLAVAGSNIQIAFSQSDGIHLVTSELEGNYTSRVWPDEAGGVVEMKAAPDGKLALLTGTALYLLDASNAMLWERRLRSEGIYAVDLAFDRARDELLVAGRHLGFNVCDGCDQGGIMLALDWSRNGDTLWQIVRERWSAGPADLGASDRYGDGWYPIAVDDAGNAVAMGSIRSTWLSMTWVGAAACGG